MGDDAWPRSNAGSERSSVIPDRRDRDRRPRHTPHKKRLAAVATHENSLKYNRHPRLPFMSGCQLCKDTRRRTYICATDFNKYLAARAQEIAQLRADVEAQQKRLSQASRSQVRMRLEEGRVARPGECPAQSPTPLPFACPCAELGAGARRSSRALLRGAGPC